MLLGGNMGMTDLQGKSAASKSNAAAVATIVSVANRTKISGRQQLERKFDPEYQKRLLKLQNMRFQSKADLMKRFPYKNELVLKKVVYTWHDLVVLSQDQVNDVLEQEWIELPCSVGRIRMNSYLKQRYIGISSPAIISFGSQRPAPAVQTETAQSAHKNNDILGAIQESHDRLNGHTSCGQVSILDVCN
jgi:hypothetical protein